MKQMRFYVKALQNSVSIYHRLSHQYLEGENIRTLEHAAEVIAELNDLRPEGLWKTLLFDYRIRLPHKDVLAGIRKDEGWQSGEDGYNNSWKYGTQQLYDLYPDLLVEEEVPYDVIHKVQEEHARRKAQAERVRQEENLRYAESLKPEPKEAKVENVKLSRKNGLQQLIIRISSVHKVNLVESNSPFD